MKGLYNPRLHFRIAFNTIWQLWQRVRRRICPAVPRHQWYLSYFWVMTFCLAWRRVEIIRDLHAQSGYRVPRRQIGGPALRRRISAAGPYALAHFICTTQLTRRHRLVPSRQVMQCYLNKNQGGLLFTESRRSRGGGGEICRFKWLVNSSRLAVTVLRGGVGIAVSPRGWRDPCTRGMWRGRGPATGRRQLASRPGLSSPARRREETVFSRRFCWHSHMCRPTPPPLYSKESPAAGCARHLSRTRCGDGLAIAPGFGAAVGLSVCKSCHSRLSPPEWGPHNPWSGLMNPHDLWSRSSLQPRLQIGAGPATKSPAQPRSGAERTPTPRGSNNPYQDDPLRQYEPHFPRCL